MVVAIAALLFQLVPAVEPPGQTLAVEADSPAPAVFAMNLPDTSASIASAAVVPSGAVSQLLSSPAPKNGEPKISTGAPAASEAVNEIQNSESFSLIRVPEKSEEEHRFVSPEVLPSRKRWIALSVAQHAAATFDAYTTRDAVSRGAIEQDPLMRPFANSSGMYAAIQVGPVLLDLAARRMQRSENNFVRHTWWLPQAASTAMFLASGAHNLQVTGRP